MSSELTFVTYNIDGSAYNLEKRLDAFLECVKSSPPDVVVIQEGTRLTYERLLREMALLGYKRQLLDVMNKRPTGEMIFSKYPISDGRYIPFGRSSENRGVSLLKIDLWGKHLWICTAQFDSTSSMSRSQITSFAHNIRSMPLNENIIFGGDTRIMEYQTDLKEPDGWCDAWYEGGTDSEKFTYNSQTNLLVPLPYKDRPDRIWYHPSDNGFTIDCVECKLYGNDSPVTISSHYGVWTRFVMRDI